MSKSSQGSTAINNLNLDGAANFLREGNKIKIWHEDDAIVWQSHTCRSINEAKRTSRSLQSKGVKYRKGG